MSVKTMKLHKFLALSSLMMVNLFTPVVGSAQETNPNGIDNKPQPGWSLWKPREEAKNADYDAGFSNMELGGYLDFEYACKTQAGNQENQLQYWFRLSNSVQRIGTGEVESGCWLNGKFLHTYNIPAIKLSYGSVDCLQVTNPQGVTIYSEPDNKSKRLAKLSQGKRVNPGSYPASIINKEDSNWIAIETPVKGWVDDGKFVSEGNFKLCRRSNPNDIDKKTDSEWSKWQSISQVKTANFSAQLTKNDQESYQEFKKYCLEDKYSNLPLEYWFRLTNSFPRIGTGKVEYGCWRDGHFIFTQTNTAIKNSSVKNHCLQVTKKQGLPIYDEAKQEGKIIGKLPYNQQAKLDYPPKIEEFYKDTGLENWLYIQSPIKGWISDGKITGKGHLKLCQ
jgi:hypothetical protein